MEKISIFLLILLFFSVIVTGYELISDRTVVRNDTIFSSEGLVLKAGAYTLNSDSAFMLRNDSIIYLPIPFRMISGDSVSISGLNGIYRSNEGIFDINGNNSYINDMHIESSNAVFNTKDSIHSFEGNVHIVQSDSSIIRCQYLNIDILKQIESANGAFQYMSADSTLQIHALSYIRNRVDSIIYFNGDSKIISKDTEMLSDSFSMDMKSDILFTPLNCSIFYGDYTISGDSLFAYFHNDTIDSAAVLSEITLLEDNKERTNAFDCRYMMMEFAEGELEQIHFTGISNAVLTLKEKANDTESE